MDLEVQHLMKLLNDIPTQWIAIGVASSTAALILFAVVLRKLCNRRDKDLKKKKRPKKPTTKKTKASDNSSLVETLPNPPAAAQPSSTTTVSSKDVNQKGTKQQTNSKSASISLRSSSNEKTPKVSPDANDESWIPVSKTKKGKKENQPKTTEQAKKQKQQTDVKTKATNKVKANTPDGHTTGGDSSFQFIPQDEDSGDWQEVRFVRRNRKHAE